MGGGGEWNALVLAAGRGPDDPMARAFGVSHKCLLPVGGVPMLRRVVEALRAHPRVGGISVVIEREDIAAKAFDGRLPEGVRVLPAADSAAASVLRAVEGEGMQLPVLVTTADHVLLDGAMLDAFLTGAEDAEDADLVVALVRREDVLARWPEARRTWLKLGRDRVTSCNLFALRTEAALKAVAFWRQAERNRKRPWKIALAFGIPALLRLLLGRGDARSVLEDLSRRLGLVARPVFLPKAEASVDVDKPEDLELAERILEERTASGA